MFENWQKLVAENQKRKVDIAKMQQPRTKKSTNLCGTKIDSVFIDDFWKPRDSNREQSSGCVFKE